MKNQIRFAIIIASFTILSSCIEEDHFGLSPYGNIKNLQVSNQASNAQINTDSLMVTVEIPAGVDLSQITIQSLSVSSFATTDKNIGDVLNLNTPQSILVTAEDKSIHNWTVQSFIASSTPQLENGDLNLWYKTSSDYYEPGSDASSTIWGTGNPGTQILNKLATIPEDLGGGNLAAKMITLDMGKLATAFGTPIAAGSLFTGFFNSDNLDPSDPEAAIEFGTPFVGRPEKLRFKYSYIPGEVNKDKNGNALDYPDACDIYALLEVRLSGKVERLATAWFRSEDLHEELSQLEIPFVYGELDNSYPEYMFPNNQNFVSADSASFILPTHITFVASSSYDGASFAGAIGSTLIIDDVEMIY